MTKSTLQTGVSRRHEAKARRANAASGVGNLPVLTPIANGDEDAYSEKFPVSFTKGLYHDAYGLVDADTYHRFRDALVSGQVDMAGLDIAAGADQRKWESPIAGVYFNDIGADPDAVAMPPAPKLGLSELCAEMATVYAMALTRDIPFEDLQNPNTPIPNVTQDGNAVTIQDLTDALAALSWYNPNGAPVGFLGKGAGLTDHEQRRRAANWDPDTGGLSVDVLFRGSTPGSKKGPYISQFMMIGTSDLGGSVPTDGNIGYGLQSTSQAQWVPESGTNYMQDWEAWLDVQQGTKFDQPAHSTKRRIHTPRDLAGYVHFDALYQAYLNACLILLGNGDRVRVDSGNPITTARAENSMGFATWGGPHILSLVTEVATRGLRAARRTKFQVHRRARPEVLAARLAQVASGHTGDMDADAQKQLNSMLSELGFDAEAGTASEGSILNWVAQANAAANGDAPIAPLHQDKNFLLPMAFVEGSPMHPAYGAGHATVAGACVTILKAFFDVEQPYAQSIAGGDTMYAADQDGGLHPSVRTDADTATIADELDKLAANISIGRNIAGVHYYSDYYDSLRMGERIAVSILEEQMHSYHEAVSLGFTSFDGDKITLATRGGTGPADVSVHIEEAGGNVIHRDVWWTRDLAEYGIADPGDAEFA